MKAALRSLAIVVFSISLFAADTDNRALYTLLTTKAAPQMQADAVRKHFSATQLTNGSAVATYMGDFVGAIESAQQPTLVINDKPAPAMRSLPGNLWVHTQQMVTGRSHAFYYEVGGKMLGDRRFDTAAYTADSYPQDGVPKGKLSEHLVCTSAVYRGHKISYWIYASPGVDPAVPSPVMIWH